MERTYQKTRTNTGAYARTRRYEEQKPLFSIKKLAVQTIASVIIFSLVYSMRFAQTPFSDRVLNEALYAVNYTVDLQSLYKSSMEIFDYLQGRIEQGRSYIDNTVLQVQNPNVPDIEDENSAMGLSFDTNNQSGEQ